MCFVFIFFVIFYVSYDCNRCYAKINPIVEKDNWPSRLCYISFILIAINYSTYIIEIILFWEVYVFYD